MKTRSLFLISAVLFAELVFFSDVLKAQMVQYSNSGVGNDSCANLILSLKRDKPTSAILMNGKNYYTEANAYTQWIAGFVSASNWMRSSTTAKGSNDISVDINGIALSVLKICEEDPAMPIGEAAADFVNREAFKK
jgi:hypothetical protein